MTEPTRCTCLNTGETGTIRLVEHLSSQDVLIIVLWDNGEKKVHIPEEITTPQTVQKMREFLDSFAAYFNSINKMSHSNISIKRD